MWTVDIESSVIHIHQPEKKKEEKNVLLIRIC